MTKLIIAKPKIDCKDLLGQFLDESNYDVLIEEDTDCFFHDYEDYEQKEQRVAFKFRKNY